MNEQNEQYTFDFDPTLPVDSQSDVISKPEITQETPPETPKPVEVKLRPGEKTILAYTILNEECFFGMKPADYNRDGWPSQYKLRNEARKEIEKQGLKGVLDEMKKIIIIEDQPKPKERPPRPWQAFDGDLEN